MIRCERIALVKKEIAIRSVWGNYDIFRSIHGQLDIDFYFKLYILFGKSFFFYGIAEMTKNGDLKKCFSFHELNIVFFPFRFFIIRDFFLPFILEDDRHCKDCR